MKYVACVFSTFLAFNAYSVGGASNNAGDEASPTIYADVSQSAIDDAVSFDGVRGIVGFGYGTSQYAASLGSNFTSNELGMFSLVAGLGYAKSFKNNILVGLDVYSDISPKKKKEGGWSSLNSNYDATQQTGTKYGKLNTDIFTPSLGIRVGYVFVGYKTVVSAKLGFSKVTGSYEYYLNGSKASDIDVDAIVPTVGLCGEHKLNRQWGVSLEANLPIKRVVKKTSNNVEHRIKVGRTDIRLLGIYSIHAN